MKVCLSYKQIPLLLKEANEISFPYNKIEKAYEYVDRYPKADMVIVINSAEIIDWEDIKVLNNLHNGKIILALSTFDQCLTAKLNEIKFFLNQRVTSLYDANALFNFGSCYIIPGPPLFFDLENLKRNKIPVRLIPNLINNNPILHPETYLESWVRPEDLEFYADYVETVEFYSADGEIPVEKERALYNVYIKDKMWPDYLMMLIPELKHSCYSYLIDDEAIRHRVSCKMACQNATSRCNICKLALDLATKESMKKVQDLVNKSIN